MKKILFLAFLSLATALGVEMDARLAPLAAAHIKATDEILKAKGAEVSKATAVYLKEVDVQDEKATKSGNSAALGAIQKEREQLKSGGILPVPNADLPKVLMTYRKALVKAIEDADLEAAKKRKDLDAKYLATLAKLTPMNEGSPELIAQIEEEKKRVTSGIYGPITNLQTQLVGTRWQSLVNAGDIAVWEPGGKFRHWKYTIPDRETVVLHWTPTKGKSWKLDKDGRTLRGDPDYRLIPPTQ
ncbi:MAG TPA: hypothetical protein VIM57_07695 [Luteolibacter sp.]